MEAHNDPIADRIPPDPASHTWLVFSIGRIISGLDEVRNGMVQIRDDVQGLWTSHSDLRADVAGVIAKIDAANTRIRQVEVDVGPLVSLGSRVTACEASISEMRPAFEKTRDAWTRFRGAVFVIAGIAIALGWLASFSRDLVTVKLGLK